MNTKQIATSVRSTIKSGFFKGVGIGAGLLTTSIFAAAAAMNVFAPGQVVSSAAINQNFTIAAPEGAVMAFYLASCPEGWAPADGTNGTPDLRGVFIRGRDDVGTGAAGNDPAGARNIGDPMQADAFQNHNHSMGANVVTLAGGWVALAGGPDLAINSSGTTGNATSGSIATETRPKNVALTYCMRKNS